MLPFMVVGIVAANPLPIEASPAPIPVTPLAEFVTEADYPPVALATNQHGKVRFRLRVDATGKPDGCVILLSSGSSALDNATCDIFLSRAKFKPALDGDGKPARGDYQAALTWVVPKPDPEERKSKSATITFEIDEAGRVISCQASDTELASALGGCNTFGRAERLSAMLQRPLAGLRTIQFRMSVLIGARDQEPTPAGATRKMLADANFEIASDGSVQKCRSDLFTISGRIVDLCAVLTMDNTRWVEDPDGKSEPGFLEVDVSTWPR